jgi:transposase
LKKKPVYSPLQISTGVVGRTLTDNGFVLYYKSLAEEKFRWPRPEEEVISLSGQQINWLLDGYDISLMKGHKKLHYEASY